MFLLQKISLNALKSDTLQQTKRFSFTQAFPYCPFRKKPFPPSISHLHPAITYCPLKNDAVLVISALTPYAVTPEPRTDSKPFRRRVVRKNGFGSCRRKYLQNYLRQSFESSPGVQRVATLWGTFGSFRTREKNKPFPFREAPRFANLESAHRSRSFAPQQLKPF